MNEESNCCRAIRPEEDQNYTGKRMNILEAITFQTYVSSFMAFMDVTRPDLSHKEKFELLRKFAIEWFKDADEVEDAIRHYAIGCFSEYQCPFLSEEK